MKPVRLSRAVAQVEESISLHEREGRRDREMFARGRLAMLLDFADGEYIVTPADEALAKIQDPFVQEGNYWNCVGCGNPRMWPSGETGHHDCAWVKAKAKVAALPETNHE